jgi:hypothetical protein
MGSCSKIARTVHRSYRTYVVVRAKLYPARVSRRLFASIVSFVKNGINNEPVIMWIMLRSAENWGNVVGKARL